MRHTVSRSIAALVAGAMLVTALPLSAAQAAAPKAKATQVVPASDDTTDISARRRHYRGGGNPAAAIAAFGLIAGAIAASQAPRYGYGYGYNGYYAPPQPYYGGYGYRRPYPYRYW